MPSITFIVKNYLPRQKIVDLKYILCYLKQWFVPSNAYPFEVIENLFKLSYCSVYPTSAFYTHFC